MYFLPKCNHYYSILIYDANGGVNCKTELIKWIRIVLTLFHNLGITLSSKLRLRLFKMLWNAKKYIYNFHVLSFERYSLHQGCNRAWSWRTCTGRPGAFCLVMQINWAGYYWKIWGHVARKLQFRITTFLFYFRTLSYF